MIYERSIKFTIESKIDSIVFLSKSIRSICNTVIDDEILLYNIELSIVEAISNVINHAYHRKTGNFIDILATIDENQIKFEIIDTGDQAIIPCPGKELEYNQNDITNLPESGMGIFLIHRVMDKITYNQVDGKNVLKMIKFLKQN